MKKIIFKSIFLLLFITLLIVSYLSIIGLETKQLNNQIEEKVKNFNQDLNIELNQIKIILDPFKFKISAKTIGSKLKLKDKIIELETIKTQISLNSLINNKFSLSNLKISTKPTEIKNLIFFVRKINDSPQLFLLEKFIKKGFLIADMNFEFDEKGKIKDNFNIDGIINDANIDFLKKYNLNRLNFTFNLKKDNFEFKNIRSSLNDIPLYSEKISIKGVQDYFQVDCVLSNKSSSLSNKNIDLFIKPLIPKISVKNINFNSENKFSFKISKNFKIKDFKLNSKINLKEFSLINVLNLKMIFPEIKKNILFKDHLINLNLEKNDLNITGNGKILIQNKDDEINYSINKKNNKFLFNTQLKISDNFFEIIPLNYVKKQNSQINLEVKGSHILSKKTKIFSIFLKEKNNIMKLKNLILDKDFKIERFEKIDLNYKDKDDKKNDININRKNKNYILSGKTFNADRLLENFIDEDSKKKNIFSKDFNFKIKMDQVYLDDKYKIKNLIGKIYLKNNEVYNANLIGFFSENKRFEFTVISKQEGKVTTLFSHEAEPLVKRYKFIKGYKGGSLDLSSINFKGKSKSTLKIYNFNLKELPALTKLLTLASLQGIADLLKGEGIGFEEFEMNFENEKNLMTIKEIYAIGPAISILMDGYVEKDKIISLRGTLVPATTINKAIGSIPVLGKILVGSKTGEGVFGVSFKIKGPPKELETTVNPIKTLTPRFITRTLEKIKKN